MAFNNKIMIIDSKWEYMENCILHAIQSYIHSEMAEGLNLINPLFAQRGRFAMHHIPYKDVNQQVPGHNGMIY